MSYKNIILTVFLILFHMIMYGEENKTYLFDSISLEDGLSNSSVSSIQQDSKGFLWFGTQSGLNRYDGYEFITYNHDTFNTNSLPHGLVQSLFIDAEDIIWIGTYNGISRFDPSTTSFTNYEYLQNDETSISNNVVTDMAKDANGQIWVGTLGGLNRLDPDSGLFTRYLHDDNSTSILNDTVRSILIDSQDRIWIGNLGGVDLYNEKNDNFTHYAYKENLDNGLPSPYVMKILEFDNDTLLVGTWGGGLTLFNISNETYQNYPLVDNRVYTMEQDEQDLIWIGTWGGGIYVFDTKDKSVTAIKKDQNLNSSITSNTIYSLYSDNTGIMWVGTNGEGLNKHNLQKKDFNFLTYNKNLENSIDSGKIEALLEDKSGNLWIGIYNGGLNHYNSETGVVTRYKHNENDDKSISNDIVTDLLEDSEGNIWVTTNDGLNMYLPESNTFKQIHLQFEEGTLENPPYTQLYEDSQNNIWIGSHNNGLFKYNAQNGELTHFQYNEGDNNTISDNLIYSIIERVNGEFWIGTNKGLNRLDVDTGFFTRYQLDRSNPQGLNNNTIRVVLEDKDNNLWIGTGGGGINLYIDETDSFLHYTTREGLSNNSIMSMVEDEKGQIWSGTKYGISIINKDTKEIVIMNQEDGLLSMEFTSGALKGSENNIYMGSIDILSNFENSTQERITHELKTHLNSIEISGEEFTDYSSYLPHADIILDYRDSNYMAFEFVALNYLNPQTTQYAHKLEGFDEDWVLDKTRRFALYTNIPPGEYTFKVKAAYASSAWSERTLEQKIRIKPPIWSTWWAKVLFSIFIMAIVYLLISLRTNHIRKQKISELKGAEKYLSSILNSMPSILIGIDENMVITQWNNQAEKTTGKSEEEIKGFRLQEMLTLVPLNLDDITESMVSGKVISKTVRHESKGNEPSYEIITIYPLVHGSKKEAVIRIDDVTKEIRMEEILIQSEKMLSVGGLAAGMAHEINNPLAGMIQNASVLKNRLWMKSHNKLNIKAAEESNTNMDAIRSYMESREIPQILESINDAGKRVSQIVDNMLSFAQKSDSEFRLDNLKEILNKTIELSSSDYDLKANYDFKNLIIVKEYDEDLPLVSCDKPKIQQVILNILKNGTEAMLEAGSKEPQFTFRLYTNESNSQIILEIEDNGPGMDENVKKRIFEPFYTTKPIGVGTGLGLSISYFIITENHKGKITVESNSGMGSKFIIKLPLFKD